MGRRMELKAGEVVYSPYLGFASKLDLGGPGGCGAVRIGRRGSGGRDPWEGSVDSPRQLQATRGGNKSLAMVLGRKWLGV